MSTAKSRSRSTRCGKVKRGFGRLSKRLAWAHSSGASPMTASSRMRECAPCSACPKTARSPATNSSAPRSIRATAHTARIVRACDRASGAGIAARRDSRHRRRRVGAVARDQGRDSLRRRHCSRIGCARSWPRRADVGSRHRHHRSQAPRSRSRPARSDRRRVRPLVVPRRDHAGCRASARFVSGRADRVPAQRGRATRSVPHAAHVEPGGLTRSGRTSSASRTS